MKEIAATGTIWVCCACGKRSRDRHGDPSVRWWDVSCMINSVLCYEDKITVKDGVVTHIPEDACVKKEQHVGKKNN